MGNPLKHLPTTIPAALCFFTLFWVLKGLYYCLPHWEVIVK